MIIYVTNLFQLNGNVIVSVAITSSAFLARNRENPLIAPFCNYAEGATITGVAKLSGVDCTVLTMYDWYHQSATST